MKNIKTYEEFVNENAANEEISLDDMKKSIVKAGRKIAAPVLLGTALAGGMSSCTKPTTNYVYKYSYEIAPGKPASSMYPFTRELTADEIADIDQMADRYVSNRWTRDIEGNLDLYRLDPDGEYAAEDPTPFIRDMKKRLDKEGI